MKFLYLFILLLILSSCAKDTQTLISKNKLGDLTNLTKISQIDKILVNDSVVNVKARNNYGKIISSTIKEVKVYDTSGQEILLIKPNTAMDTVSLIKSIRILTNKYKTKSGIGLGSSYAKLKKHHKIGNIQSSVKSVILSLNDINAIVSFDRAVLPGDVRFDMDAEIKSTMIPDDAKINRFWLNFDAENNVEK